MLVLAEKCDVLLGDVLGCVDENTKRESPSNHDPHPCQNKRTDRTCRLNFDLVPTASKEKAIQPFRSLLF